MTKVAKICIVVPTVLVLIIAAFLIFWYFGKSYPAFSANAQKEWNIPGLKDGYTPQGLWNDQNNNVILSCGYMKDGSASRVYVLGENQRYFTLTNPDGTAYTGHSGGIATYNNFGYVVGDKHVYVFNLSQALLTNNGESVQIDTIVESPNGADFITVEEDTIYIGEFYREKNYPSEQTHKIECADGINPAVTFAFRANDELPYGFDILNPQFAISTTALVQGMCFIDGKVVLSTSYSLADSKIYVYNDLSTITPKSVDYGTFTVDTYILDSSNLVSTIVAPCMSEEIISYNGRVCIMFENACKKYSFITRTRYKNVYSININDFMPKQ